MTTHSSTPFKLDRKLSVQGELVEHKNTINLTKHNSMQPQFYTQNSIQFKPLMKYHSGQHDKNSPGSKKILRNLVSINDQNSNMEYSSTDQVSRTFIGLKMRKGLSFQKEKIDFSLSSQAQDAEQQNLILRKKIAEMRKEVSFYRDHDEIMFQDGIKVKEKADSLENQVSKLRLQLELSHSKIIDLEEQLKSQHRRIQELQRILAHKQGHSKQAATEVQKQLQHYQSLARRHQDEVESLKQHYEHELFQNSLNFRKLLDQANQKFENAKVIGQNQINQLVAKLLSKDKQIAKMRNTLDTPKQGLHQKASMLFSDHQQKSRDKDSPKVQTPGAYKYMNRFIQFSQFIDQRINKSTSKEKKPHGRISKSAINKDNQAGKRLANLAIKMPESPSSAQRKGDRYQKITSLANKTGTPPHYPQTHTF